MTDVRPNTPRSRRLPAATFLALGLLALPGCVSPFAGDGPAPAGRSIDAAAEARYRANDPVFRSGLRETALATLEEAAASSNAALRANSLEALAGFTTRVQPLLGPALVDENVGVRTVAAMVVGRSQLAEVAPAVRPLLSDPSPRVRAAAIYALAAIGESPDQSSLATMLLTDPDLRIRAHAAFVLGEIGNPSALGLLKEASAVRLPRSPDSLHRLLRLQIAEAMVKLGDEEQLQPVRAALFPSSAEELEAVALAAQIIGELGDAGSDDQLIYLTAFWDQNRNPMPAEIRLAAAGSLPQLGDYDGSFIADQYVENERPAIRAQAAFVYGEAGRPENLAVLEQLLKNDPEPGVRVAAAAAILQILQDLEPSAG